MSYSIERVQRKRGFWKLNAIDENSKNGTYISEDILKLLRATVFKHLVKKPTISSKLNFNCAHECIRFILPCHEKNLSIRSVAM